MPLVITQATVTKALADAVPGGRRYDIVDARSQGLSLRVSPRGVQWSLRFQVAGKDRRIALGGVDQWSIAEAREIAAKAQAMLRDRVSIPNDDWIDRLRRQAGKIVKATLVAAQPARPRELFLWTLKDAREIYLKDRAQALRPVTVDDYRHKLTSPEIAVHDKTVVARITRQDMATAVALIHRSGRETHAENVVRAVSAFWSWMARDEWIQKSGVARDIMRGLRAPDRSLREDEDEEEVYVPTLSEVGRVIAIARSGALHSTVAAAVELTAWTIQRRRTIVEARIDQFESIGNGLQGLWVIPPKSLKKHKRGGKRRPPHVVPLPSAAWQVVLDQIRRVDGESEWLFPQIRARFKGKLLKHVVVDTISHTLQHMPGVQTTAHGLRRAFATHGEALLGLLRADTQAILDHAESSTTLITSTRAGRSDVTGVHYSLHDQTHRTWPIMNAWVGAIEPLIDVEAAKLPPIAEIKRLKREARERTGAEDECRRSRPNREGALMAPSVRLQVYRQSTRISSGRVGPRRA